MAGPVYEPIILTQTPTADLYILVTFSVAPGRIASAIVGPRGATEDQVREAVRHLASNINT